MKPGIYDVPHKDYHEHPEYDAVHSSDFQQMQKSMAHFRYYRENPPERDLFDFGRLFHMATLEPHLFDHAVAVFNGRKQGKAWDNFKEQAKDKVIVKPDEFDQMCAMAQAVEDHPLASAIINHQNAEIEKSVFWYDEQSGEKCKCRPDLRIESESLVADLKGVQSAQPGMFSRACANYGYQFQAPFYLDGVTAATGIEHKHFLFLCVEKDPPHGVMIYEADFEFLEIGRTRYRELLLQYADCKIKNEWPGYPVEIQELSLPVWAKRID